MLPCLCQGSGRLLWSPTSASRHDGRATTGRGAIQLHGGQAADARAAFEKLSTKDQEALFAFLGSIWRRWGQSIR